jgi:3-isopropylmalate/(R)-2-methylmalate dehydratase small subunit
MTSNGARINHIAGTAVPFIGNDIDTDRIIPARFLRCVTFEGLGEQVFRDERFDEQDNPVDHPLNDPRFSGASILIVNANFGCGSSREHAPQAIMRYGIRAIIGESFAEIFAGNCLSLGIPTFTADQATVRDLQTRITNHPDTVLYLDIEQLTATMGTTTVTLAMSKTTQSALVSGTWDSLEQLLANEAAIDAVYDRIPYLGG